jgi:hypothetical protein
MAPSPRPIAAIRAGESDLPGGLDGGEVSEAGVDVPGGQVNRDDVVDGRADSLDAILTKVFAGPGTDVVHKVPSRVNRCG